MVHIQKLKLEDLNIPFILFDQRDSSYNSFGYIYLNVLVEDQSRALEIINKPDE